jgi:hypothetical protein
MKLVAVMIAALSLISTTYTQGQHTYNGKKPELMQTTNDITMVAPALEKYAQGPVAESDHDTPYSAGAAVTREVDKGELLSASSACEIVGARKVWNCTRSFVNRRSRVQSKATRSFFSNLGSLLR